MFRYNLRNKIDSLAPNLVATNNTETKSEADKKISKGSNSILSAESEDEDNEYIEASGNMAMFSAEQFQQILAVMGNNNKVGSFTLCTARFKGQRDPAAVEEFLAAISVYKDVEKISDEDAVRGMPLLLEDYAASWWIGVKNTVHSFEEAKKIIRATFSPPLPDWRIFASLFETKQQKREPTDSFICKKRLLLSQLKVPVAEEVQLNLVYGLLNLTIRERVRRECIKTFGELISASREAEMFLIEARPTINAETATSNRCCFCRMKGHSIENCFKKKKRDEQQAKKQDEEQQVNQKSYVSQANTALIKKPTFSCYGCGTPGVYRANCPTCSKHTKESPQYLAFNMLSTTTIGHSLPSTHIEIFGLKGEAVFDTGAKTSVASLNLKKILTKNGCIFQDVRAEITLANGSTTTGKVMHTICDMKIGERVRKIRLIYLPNASRNRTLLGADFLEQAGIVLNMAQRCWYFEDTPKTRFLFTNPLEMGIFNMDINTNESSPCTKAIKEVSKFIKYFEDKKIISPLVNTPKNANDYSPHSIQNIFRDAIPVGERTPETVSTLFAPPRKIPKCDENDIHMSEIYLPLFSLDIQILKNSDGIGLSEKERKDLDTLLMSYEDVFKEPEKATSFAVHRIHTEIHDPIAMPPYRLSPSRKTALKEEIKRMLKLRVIVECQSPWAAPVVIIPKKSGGIRVCVDYRELNAITKPDRYPLPRVDDIIHEAKVTRYMSTLDLQSGYWQIGVHPDDQDKTAFITPFGMYKFTRMPFGLRNAPATFQRLIDRIKTSLEDTILLAYLDDIISCSPTFEQHLKDLNKIFQRLREFGLKVNLEKCQFACNEVKYLGHMLTPQGIMTDPQKVSAIRQRKEPKNVKELLSFLQACSWYRRFIPSFADVSKPLSILTKKNIIWSWTTKQQHAFDKLKELLTTAPILKQASDDQTFVLKTDASGYALGAVLLQGEGADEHPIEYASRLLSSAEQNYSTIEREALAIVWAVQKFRGYFEGSSLKLITDHQPLKWLMKIKSPTGRLARWALSLQPFNIEIEYKPGKTNVVADTLSRPPCQNDHDKSTTCDICVFSIEVPRKNSGEIREGQLKDPDLRKIIQCFETNSEDNVHWYKRGFVMNNGVLYIYSNDDFDSAQLVVPIEERADILKYYHNEDTAGHYGINKTINKITSRYYWPGIRKDIEKYVKQCIECQRYKATNLKPAGLYQTIASNQRFEVVAIDLFGPLPLTSRGFQWIFIIEDVASRWIELFPIKIATAEACARTLIDEIFLRYGVPRKIISDNGVQFVSAVMQKVLFCLNVHHMLTPVYHPEANPVERKNRDLKSQLAILVGSNHQVWDEKLASIRFAMNTTVCQSTEYTPAFLTFGRELRTLNDVQHDLKAIIQSENFVAEITPYLHTLVDVFRNVKENVYKQQDHNKRYSNDRRRNQPSFEVGSKVLVTTHVLSNTAKGVTSKFVPKRDGPYVIIEKKGTTSYVIAHEDDLTIPLGTYHASALTPLVGDENKTQQPVQIIRQRGRPRKT